MHIIIVGPGALGSLITARLTLVPPREEANGADNDDRITLLDYKPQRAETMARDGLVLETSAGCYRCRPEVTAAPEVCAGADILFLCVKTTTLGAALARVRPFLVPNTLVLAMQNGIAHPELLAALPSKTGLGITTEGATLLAPGRVRHAGKGLTRLGLLSSTTSAAEHLLEQGADLLNRAGLDTKITRSPLRHLWAKLFINVGINALSALKDCPNGALLDSPDTREQMIRAIREAEAVALASGIPIDEDPVAVTFRVCAATGSNISSMLQDVRRARRTEIDAINGAVVAEGRRLGIPTPVNIELVRQVRELESTFAEVNGGGS